MPTVLTPVIDVTSLGDITEGGCGGMMFTRTVDTSGVLMVNYTIGGTADNSDHGLGTSGTIMFADGVSTGMLAFTVTDDSDAEPTEAVTLSLTASSLYDFGAFSTASVSITDNDPPPVITVEKIADATEGGTGGLLRFTRTGGNIAAELTVFYSTDIYADGAATPGVDYAPLLGYVTFAANATTANVSVDLIDDTAAEMDELIIIALAEGPDYLIGTQNVATVVALDNDLPAVSVYTKADAVEGGDSAMFRLMREGNISQELTVNFTLSGTAVIADDYASRPLSATFEANENIVDIPVAPVDDGIEEPTETIALALQASGLYDFGAVSAANARLFDIDTAPPPRPIPFVGTGTGLFAQYYNTKDLFNLIASRVDPKVDFNWMQGSPQGVAVGPDKFSIRWAGFVQATRTEDFKFFAMADDGVRLWINDQLVTPADAWSDHPPKEYESAAIPLVAGQKYAVKLEYYENTFGASVTLSWKSANQEKQAIPQSQLYPVRFDLDVDANGSLDDAVDGADKYQPGYKGNEQILTPMAEQAMQVIATGLTPNATYNVRLSGTTKYAGIASNMGSATGSYASTSTDNDYVLVKPQVDPADPIELVTTDETDVAVTADANGKLTVGIRARDFGGATTVKVTDANGRAVASLQLPRDGDGDKLPDVWEDKYAAPPAGFTGLKGFDKAKAQSVVAGKSDADTDEDRNKGGKLGKNAGDRIPAFDEYRGFFVDGVYRRTDPLVKQIFVYSPDKDPFLSFIPYVNPDGLNRIRALGESMRVGAYAEDLDAEIMLLLPGEFDGNAARLGDVNYNSPAPYNDIKQKYVWVVTDLDKVWGFYGLQPSLGTGQVLRGPNSMSGLALPAGPHNGKKAVVVNLGMIRTDVAFIDRDGSATPKGGDSPNFMLVRGNGTLPANALRDASRHVTSGGTPLSLFYFSAGDKVRWNDRNADSHWDRGDELWIDVDGDNKYSAGDKVIFDHDSNLNVANNTAGIAVDAQTEFRYVRKTLTNTVGTYTEGDYIYTTYFNWELYTAIRDNVLAHEALGHRVPLPRSPSLRCNCRCFGFSRPVTHLFREWLSV